MLSEPTKKTKATLRRLLGAVENENGFGIGATPLRRKFFNSRAQNRGSTTLRPDSGRLGLDQARLRPELGLRQSPNGPKRSPKSSPPEGVPTDDEDVWGPFCDGLEGLARWGMVSGSVKDMLINSGCPSFSHKDTKYSFPCTRTLPRQ